MKPRLLDFFCKAGGCAKGYDDAGFEVIGVDIEFQPRYPYAFVQADALSVLGLLTSDGALEVEGQSLTLRDFAVIHGSPPCQADSRITPAHRREMHQRLIEPFRDLLYCPRCDGTGNYDDDALSCGPCPECMGDKWAVPYVIENVPGAPLHNPIQLCGSSFGLPLQKHRLFESNVPLMALPCAHGQWPAKYDVYEHGHWYKSPFVKVYGSGGGKANEHWAEAMGISWMTHEEMAQAIPPAFTEHVGAYLLTALNHRKAA